MTTNNELHEGDYVRVIDGKYRGRYGKIVAIGLRKGFKRTTPICLVYIPYAGKKVTYLRDEIERVESEVGNG